MLGACFLSYLIPDFSHIDRVRMKAEMIAVTKRGTAGDGSMPVAVI
jgi:hypothetical protein